MIPASGRSPGKLTTLSIIASLVAESVKNPPAMRGTWVGKIPGGWKGYPLQYSFLENLHEQKSLAGYTVPGSQSVGWGGGQRSQG